MDLPKLYPICIGIHRWLDLDMHPLASWWFPHRQRRRGSPRRPRRKRARRHLIRAQPQARKYGLWLQIPCVRTHSVVELVNYQLKLHSVCSKWRSPTLSSKFPAHSTTPSKSDPTGQSDAASPSSKENHRTPRLGFGFHNARYVIEDSMRDFCTADCRYVCYVLKELQCTHVRSYLHKHYAACTCTWDQRWRWSNSCLLSNPSCDLYFHLRLFPEFKLAPFVTPQNQRRQQPRRPTAHTTIKETDGKRTQRSVPHTALSLFLGYLAPKWRVPMQ